LWVLLLRRHFTEPQPEFSLVSHGPIPLNARNAVSGMLSAERLHGKAPFCAMFAANTGLSF
jgi:hypothetical protein